MKIHFTIPARNRRWTRLLAVAMTAIAGTVTVTTAQAGAADAAQVPATATSTQTVIMQSANVVKVLSNKPDATGHVAVRLSNGATISILAKYKSLVTKHAAEIVTPDNQVVGNCGTSWIYLSEHNGAPVRMDTGFGVHQPALEYSWHAWISGFSGSGYDYNYQASGDLAFDYTWHGGHTSGHAYPHGTYAAGVDSGGASWALTDTGSICYAGAPYDDRYL